MAEKVIDGPGKFDLMLSLFEQKILQFTIAPAKKIRAQVYQISWKGKNYWTLEALVEGVEFTNIGIEIWYNSKTRKGAYKRIN